MEGNGSPKTPERRFSRRLSSLNSVQADESSAAEEKSPTIKRRFRSKKKPPPDNAGKRFYFINSVKILFLFIIEMVKSKPIDIGSLVMKFTYRNTM